MSYIIIFISFFVIALIVDFFAKKNKKERLTQEYGEEIATRIMKKIIWHGETETQLIESMGKPQAIDTKYLKTKTKEIWKYHSFGKNRFKTRITIDEGIVVGWDIKD